MAVREVDDGKVGGLRSVEAEGELLVVAGVFTDAGVPGRVIPEANGAEPVGGTEALRCMLFCPPCAARNLSAFRKTAWMSSAGFAPPYCPACWW